MNKKELHCANEESHITLLGILKAHGIKYSFHAVDSWGLYSIVNLKDSTNLETIISLGVPGVTVETSQKSAFQ